MLKKRTLFVLGAGASEPYKLPLGAELRDLLCSAGHIKDLVSRELIQSKKFTTAEINEFTTAFKRSGNNSIDHFLGRNPRFESIGKLLIAGNICARENIDFLFSNSNQDNWYQFVFNNMIDDSSSMENFSNNPVRFVTFNYDRSLECYFQSALSNSYGRGIAESQKVFSKISLMHLYGSVGDLNVNDQTTLKPYQTDIDIKKLEKAASGIKIIPDDRSDDREFQLARNWFDWAEVVYILGFGFDRLNCERLGFDSVLEVKKERGRQMPEIFISTYLLTQAEKEKAGQHLFGDWFKQWKSFDTKCLLTLREAGIPD